MPTQAFDSGVSILRPLYYAWPEEDQAYTARSEYMFGDDMLVAPVTQPAKDGIATGTIWLPPGRWFDQNRGELVEGGRTISRDSALDEVPVFVRAGAAVPLNPPTVKKLQEMDNSRLVLRVCLGGKTMTRVYSDGGDSEGYRSGEYAFTPVVSQRDGRPAMITVQPRQGHCTGQPGTAQVAVEFPVTGYPETITVDGKAYARSNDGREGGWSYDGATLTARAVVPPKVADRSLTVAATFADTAAIDGLLSRMKRVRTAVEWLKSHWTPPSPLPDDVSRAAQLDLLIDDHPEQLATLVAQFDARLPTLAKQVNEVEESRATPEVKAQFARLMDGARR